MRSPEGRQTSSPVVPAPEKLAAESPLTVSKAFLELPDEDRAWVLAQTDRAVSAGQIGDDSRFEFIDQLATVRQFAVDERQQAFIAPEDAQ